MFVCKFHHNYIKFMIKKFLNRKLDHRDKKEIRTATIHFRNTVICGAAFHIANEIIQNTINPDSQPHEFSSLIIDSINSGIDLATFGLVDSLMMTYFKPEIRSIKQWIPWTIGTCVATTCAVRAVRTPIKNLYVNGKLSYAGYFNGILMSTAHCVGFNTSTGLAALYLPPPSKMGGSFARKTAVLTLGNLGASIATAPFLTFVYGESLGNILKSFWVTIPGIMFDHTMFELVNTAVTKKLPFK
ncbi:hypothetical protein TRFO_42202 [Tritrichomonas foetus]|uniref:Uncharacterized protein n=1 Tax=Tritrichomonas foetus TaxID=1144522 RepID=A0A1J4KXC8_9EUKA|nr:hypothetical protein TRFO_42202 [Tritrichomonas foetus]|eukprot:OHT15907.1 hypothetical protein TRFO_42202 [Tritrichomonas foetus]